MHAFRKWRALGVAFAITLTAGLAIAQQSSVGGMPSRPRFAAITVNGDANLNTIDSIAVADFARQSQANTFTATQEVEGTSPIVAVDETDAAANERSWLLRSSGGLFVISTATDAAPTTATANAILIDRTGTTIDSVNLTATAVQTNGIDITAATTSATGTVTGCTTAPTATFRYTRNGNMAVMHIDSTGAACTSNATTFTFTNAVPVGFRPARQHECVLGATNNGTNEFALGIITNSATFTLARLVTGSSGWTNSGSKAVDVGATCTYLMQ